MKYKLLSAVASVAFIATGVAAYAQQDNQKRDQNPAAERVEPKAPAGQMERRQNTMKSEAPAAKEAPRAAEGERKEAPKAAEGERKDAPKAAEGERKEPMRPAANEQRQPNERTGANDQDRNAAQHREGQGAARVTGNIKMSSEHATRVSEILGRNSRTTDVNVNIQVGGRVPEGVEILPLPAEVIALAPEYRGYDYFVANDEIVFVAPDSHEIVGSIGYEGRAASEENTTRVAGARPCPVEQ
jgi:hypothetical protein